jgi:hypothetical protein
MPSRLPHTDPYKNALGTKAQKSPAGMAYFTGTGPASTWCHECSNFRTLQVITGKGVCLKFRKDMNLDHDAPPRPFKGATLSCKYFQADLSP